MSQSQTTKFDVTHRVSLVTLWTLLFGIVGGLYALGEHEKRREAAFITGGDVGKTIVNLGLESRIITDSNGIIVACSPTAADIAGYTPVDLIGQSSTILMPGTYKDRHLAAFSKAMADRDRDGKVNIVRCNVLKKDGTLRPVEVIVRVVDGPRGWGKIAVVTLTPVESIEFTPIDKPTAEVRKESIKLPTE